MSTERPTNNSKDSTLQTVQTQTDLQTVVSGSVVAGENVI